MPINTPYASVSEADTIIGDVSPWNNAEPTQKDYALQIGRAYIDSKYTCVSIDESAAPDPVKIANAKLANIYLDKGDTFFGDQTILGLKKKRVKAGSVESEKEFDSNETTPADPYPEITAILYGYCTKYGSTGYVTR